MRTMSNPKIERLRRCSLFSSFTDRRLAEIAMSVDEFDVGEGRVLTTQGEPARQAFVILEGEALVMVDGVAVATLGPGDLVGELGLLEKTRRSATVITASAVLLLAMDPRAFRDLMGEHKFSHQVSCQLARRLRGADQRLADTMQQDLIPV